MSADNLVQIGVDTFVDPDEVIAVDRPAEYTFVFLKIGVERPRDATDLRVLMIATPVGSVLRALRERTSVFELAEL